MKKILLFGAGKSSSVLMDYLLEHAVLQHWTVTIVDVQEEVVLQKINGRPHAVAVGMDIKDSVKRIGLIQEADVVISLMPPALHFLIAQDCIRSGKHLLTASYADKDIYELNQAAKEKGIIILCEMGLDPGIDHMSALELIDKIREQGGMIQSFRSHCGGLVAPESDNNPWHYKISWNPRNVVNAGKQGAEYLADGAEIQETYESLFDPTRQVFLNDKEIQSLAYYPNRNSLSYIGLYRLDGVKDFIRTTLRHVDFMIGWKQLIQLKLTDEQYQYEVKGWSLKRFFEEHLKRSGFESWLQKELAVKLKESIRLLIDMPLSSTKTTADNTDAIECIYLEAEGDCKLLPWSEVYHENLKELQEKVHQANLILEQFMYLGLEDDNTLLPFETGSAADILQFALENKLALMPDDKDMVVMLHEIGYVQNGQKKEVKSQLIVKGKDAIRTAMAKTVGLPLGIAAKLILDGKLTSTGVQIPTVKEIYVPVLEELKKEGIEFIETYDEG